MRYFGNLSQPRDRPRADTDPVTVGGLLARDLAAFGMSPAAIPNDGTGIINNIATAPTAATPPTLGNAYSEVFTYDPHNWLVSAKQHTSSASAARSFTYDAEGNITAGN